MTTYVIRTRVRDLGLSGRAVCLHSSLRSFTRLADGPRTVIDGFLDEGCTLLVPTFSSAHSVAPGPQMPRPARNGTDYDSDRYLASAVARPVSAYTPSSDVIDVEEMGRIAHTVLHHEHRVRGDHPLCSFSAIGPLARQLVEAQTAEDVLAPLAVLVELEGAVVLAGVGLTAMTLLHLAELGAGRQMFVRWAMTPSGVSAVRVGGCSGGFEGLAPALSSVEATTEVAGSRWRVFDAGPTLTTAIRAITATPEVTRCEDDACLRCQESIDGGPTWPEHEDHPAGPFVTRRHHGARGPRATVMCLRCCKQVELTEPTQQRIDACERSHRCGGPDWARA